jgi:ABC-2 type transport system permease protein
MLAKREWIRFFRQPFRVVAALGQPILFWILFGTGLHGAFRGASASEDFMNYFLPGTAALILLFTAIFATISIIEDRREGFLQGVLVAPPSRWSIAAGKILGGAAIAWAQAVVFLALAALMGTLAIGWTWIPLLLFLLMASLAITGMGVCFAWPMDSTQGYHAAMNMVMLPMWLLSGAFFPIPVFDASQPLGQRLLHGVMRCNPMTYVVSGIRHLMTPGTNPVNSWLASPTASWLMTFLFAAAMLLLATWIVQRRQKGEYQ